MSDKIFDRNELEDRINGFDVNQLLKRKGRRNQPLDFEEAYLLGVYSLAPYVDELEGLFPVEDETAKVQSVAALSTFHNHALYQSESSAEQIAGVCAAVFDYDIGTSENGFIVPLDGQTVMDNCGMGGDLIRTPNLSTVSALIAASDGVPMLKHGSPGNTDNKGSSDFLRDMGADLFIEDGDLKAALKDLDFGYTEALDEGYKRIHLQTHHYARIAHMNDIIGPVTNPVLPERMTKRVVGVNHLMPPRRVAEAYKLLNDAGVTNVDHGLFVRGYCTPDLERGIDEASIMPGGTLVAELRDGEILERRLYAGDFGLEEITGDVLNPGSNKSETSRDILLGRITDGKRDITLANTSLLFYLDRGDSFSEGVERAESLIESGRPGKVLKQYVAYSNGGGV